MKKRKFNYMELGMLLGIFVGGGLATIMFAATGNALYFGLVGVGLALGVGLGAAYDGAQKRASEADQQDN